MHITTTTVEANPYKIRCNMEWLKAESKARGEDVPTVASSLQIWKPSDAKTCALG